MFDSVLIFSALALILGLILGYAAYKFKVKGNPLVDQIDSILPQLQCGQCNYPGCRPYAEAIASEEAIINQCPPGGQEVVDDLAELLNIETMPLNAEEFGETKPKRVALIDEPICIGCTLCIQICPVDAIVGATKTMTTIIADECTGCDLCPPVCPVDCISMVEVKPTLDAYVPNVAEIAHA